MLQIERRQQDREEKKEDENENNRNYRMNSALTKCEWLNRQPACVFSR